jgi:hypothetical protein
MRDVVHDQLTALLLHSSYSGEELDKLKAAEEALLQAELEVAARAAEAAAAMTGEGPGLDTAAEPDSVGHESQEVQQQEAEVPEVRPPSVLAQQAPQSVPASPMLGRKRGPIQPPVPSFAAAHYVLDFGCIVKVWIVHVILAATNELEP